MRIDVFRSKKGTFQELGLKPGNIAVMTLGSNEDSLPEKLVKIEKVGTVPNMLDFPGASFVDLATGERDSAWYGFKGFQRAGLSDRRRAAKLEKNHQ